MSVVSAVVLLWLACVTAAPSALSLEPRRQPGGRTVYGYVHMAKVAGTNLNGALSMRYERVCGNKGYSYDAFQHNERVRRTNSSAANAHTGDVYGSSGRRGRFNRGRVQEVNVEEIGFDRCDFISLEGAYHWWVRLEAELRGRNASLQLHVPCREPVDHLMSQANARGLPFDCGLRGAALEAQIDGALMFQDRFSAELLRSPVLSVRCLDSAFTFDRYAAFLERRLQTRKIVGAYEPRVTNRNRDRSGECVWAEQEVALRTAIEQHLRSSYDYYSFCHSCIGSADDLTRAEYEKPQLFGGI